MSFATRAAVADFGTRAARLNHRTADLEGCNFLRDGCRTIPGWEIGLKRLAQNGRSLYASERHWHHSRNRGKSEVEPSDLMEIETLCTPSIC
jgi:hypothetical protein